ncbi:unnamed protein product [Cyberlindnera jadinii]|uniref:Major facilitator superfamily (MFS) profile domain-containing protein n=1 Tax=Cyberlindnera jadinii (strain ATCC 18201 / CBS 1600 / BCRC 20928 / JCM 3617 / NBRC 0987 / NRRL Y-1542) TaxID=983966 RepID=A0A0H5C865_CYBJN|nr:unnamed protein product [Cyberlindnera jadinii]
MFSLKEETAVENRELKTSDCEVHKTIKTKDADVSLRLFEEYESQAGELTPELEKKIVMKLWLTVFPIVFLVNFMLFLDKNAMSYATLLGMFEDLDLDQQKYSNLQTFLYLGYLLGQIPSHLIFQKIPLKYYVSGATLIWSFLTLIHLTCQNYSQLAAVRFLLGLCESGVTPCLAHTIAMWFTPEEQAIVAPVFWISSSGQGLFGGPISYGVQFVQGVSPWKIYWTIIGVLTFVVSMSSLVFYPSNPASFWIFTPVERVHIIKRIKSKTNSSIEQKVVKREQIVEALKDPITWLFFWFVFFNMFSNNISFQSAIIYKNLGFSNLQSTLVAIASAGYSTVAAVVGSTMLSRYKAQSAHVGTAFLIIALLGCILAIALPLSQSYGILAGTF